MLNIVACSFHYATSPTNYSSNLQSIVYKNIFFYIFYNHD